MYKPLLKDCKNFTNYKIIPISKEISADIKSPMEVLAILKNVTNKCFLLESLESSGERGRYTFLGYNPIMRVEIKDKIIKTNGKEVVFEHPNNYIRKILKKYEAPRFDYLPSFTGGFVGYFAYDYIKYNEPKLKLDAKDPENFNDVDLLLFDKVIAYDNLTQKIFVIINIKTDKLETNYKKGIEDIEIIIDLIKKGKKFDKQKNILKTNFKTIFTKEEFMEKVDNCKKYIYEGDIFQVVPSNRVYAEFSGSLYDTFDILRKTNPSPYMFYLNIEDLEIAGASPETLVKLEKEIVYTYPLAGTRRRGIDEQEDKLLEKELLSDPKELAEHNMLVDLGRNDLGRISKIGSVVVEKYMDILRFSHVMHIGSVVKGKIKEEYDSLDAISAVLPAGTLSGAPKIRAMEIINEQENDKRGIYGGAIGYIDFAGDMDMCIAIRIAYKKNNKVFVRSGGGIVADSIPENEHIERENKAKAVINAIISSTEGKV